MSNWEHVERYLAIPREPDYLGQYRTSYKVVGQRKGEMFREEVSPGVYGREQDEEKLMDFIARNEERKWHERAGAQR